MQLRPWSVVFPSNAQNGKNSASYLLQVANDHYTKTMPPGASLKNSPAIPTGRPSSSLEEHVCFCNKVFWSHRTRSACLVIFVSPCPLTV
eukprot:2463783-Amphidinium_carterae.1